MKRVAPVVDFSAYELDVPSLEQLQEQDKPFFDLDQKGKLLRDYVLASGALLAFALFFM